MKAIEILRNDHKVITGLFRQLEGLHGRGEMIRTILEELRVQIDLHARTDLEIFYPTLNEASQAVNDVLTEEMLRRSSELLESLAQSCKTALSEGEIPELEEQFRQHLDLEENHLLPRAVELLSAKLDLLGECMQVRHTSPQFAELRSGGEQKRRAS